MRKVTLTTIKPWPFTSASVLKDTCGGIEPLFAKQYIRRKKIKMYLVKVKVDTNDADYIEGSGYVTQEELDTLKRIIPLIQKQEYNHNWPRHEYVSKSVEDMYAGILTDEEIALIDDLCSSRGENGFHSIDSITAIEVVGEEIRIL